MTKVIVRIKGGLGNQLFCYAAARRLALVNNAELVIDDVTGFLRDRQYRRRYALDPFNIAARKATSAERLEPFERYRRGAMKWLAQGKPFEVRQYVEEEGSHFDARLLNLKVRKTLYLDGLWQSERYFEDVSLTIRDDLRIISPMSRPNQRVAEAIRGCRAVCLHVRWFDAPDCVEAHNVSADYYRRAVAFVEDRVDTPHYFVFSDYPERALERIRLLDRRVTLVSHNQGRGGALADLWLMTQCQHFVTANSTFSWWAAWLGAGDETIVVTPRASERVVTSDSGGVVSCGWKEL